MQEITSQEMSDFLNIKATEDMVWPCNGFLFPLSIPKGSKNTIRFTLEDRIFNRFPEFKYTYIFTHRLGLVGEAPFFWEAKGNKNFLVAIPIQTNSENNLKVKTFNKCLAQTVTYLYKLLKEDSKRSLCIKCPGVNTYEEVSPKHTDLKYQIHHQFMTYDFPPVFLKPRES